jgi:outer membrane protein assembly factor BamA
VLEIEEENQDYLGLGLRYDTRWSFSALLGAQLRNRLGRGSILNFDFVFSSRVNLFGLYSINAGLGRWLMPGAAGNYVDDYIETYEDGERISRRGVRAGRAGITLESNPGYWIRILAGAGGEWYSIRPDIAPLETETQSGGLFMVGGDFWIDTLDRSWMPRSGIKLKVSGQYFPESSVNEVSYNRSYGHLLAAVPLHRRVSVRTSMIYGITGGGMPLPHHMYYLGGIMSWFDYYGERDVSFFGYEPFELAGANAWMGQADIRIQITSRWLLLIQWNAGAAENDRSVLFEDENIYTGGGWTVAYETPVGPAELTLSGSEKNDSKFWFSFGYRF